MNNKIKSKPIKKLCIFAGVGVLLSLAVILIFIFTNDPVAIKVTMWVFSGIFFVVGSIILWVQLLHFVVLEDDKLIRYRSIFKKQIDIKSIDKVVNNDGLFDIIVNGKRFVTLSSDDENTKLILIALEKQDVKIKW